MKHSAMEEVGQRGVGGLDFGGGGGFFPVAEPEATEGEVLENQEAVGDFERLAGHRAEGDVRRTGREGVGDIQGARAADGVEAKLGQRATAELAGLAAEVAFLGDNYICAEGEEFGEEFCAADEIERAEAKMAGELDDSATGSGVRGVLGDPLTGLERGEIVKESPRGRGVHREHRGLVDIDLVGQRDGVFSWQDEFLGPSAKCKWQNFLADAEVFNSCAEGQDFAAAFVADCSRKSGKVAVGAFDDIEVGGIDRRGEHSHQNLAGSGCGRWNFLHAEGGWFFPKGKKSTSQRHDRMVSHRSAGKPNPTCSRITFMI